MRLRSLLMSIPFLCLAAVPPATADVVNLGAVKDNTLFSHDSDASSGSGFSLFCGGTGTAGLRRAVLAFDVAGSIPFGSAINSVTLTVYVERSGPVASFADVYSLHRLNSDWGEAGSNSPGGMGAPAQEGDATWANTFWPDQFWNTTGGDYNATASATTAAAPNGFFSWSSAQMATDVASWVNVPGGNFGWIMIGNESTPRTARLLSSRIGLNPPLLTVDFTAPSGAGAVPNGDDVPGTPLLAGKSGTPGAYDLDLSWSVSCRNAPDYSVYVGTIGDWYSHRWLLCSTGGATTASFSIAAGDDYYLIVPVSAEDDEGSYGTDGTDPRPRGIPFCPRSQIPGDPVCP